MNLDVLKMIAGVFGAALAVATLPGSIELLLLTVGGLLRVPHRRPRDPPSASYKIGYSSASQGEATGWRLMIVVPAHNEETVIQRCLQSLLACDKTGANVRVVVVADNCTDATAERAAEVGTRVLLRHEPDKRGKGYALAFAFDVLQLEGFDAVVVVDADTVVEPNFLAEFWQLFAAGADAVQCRYGVKNPQASLRTRLMQYRPPRLQRPATAWT